MARTKRMRGYNVLHPFGWDAFGLPAENAAIKSGIHPETSTLGNIAHMKGQLQRLGISYAWERELATCLPDYYKWNQWLFIRMFERGLAYRRRSRSTGARADQTVLANEQVVDGALLALRHAGRRRATSSSGSSGSRAYADELLDGADAPDRVAREGADDAAELDRAVARARASSFRWPRASRADGDRGLHDAHRHDLRRDVRAAGARAPAGRRVRRRESADPAAFRAAGRSVSRAGSRRAHDAARSRRKASTPAATRDQSVHRTSPCRSGSPTSCSASTAPARSWPCRRTTSATSSSRASTTCRSASSCTPDGEPAPTPTTMTEAVADVRRARRLRASSTGCRRTRRDAR